MRPNYSYQGPLIDETYEALLTHKKVVLAACPGAGKTNMAIEVIRKVLEQDRDAKILVLTHGQTLLRQQWVNRFHQVSKIRVSEIVSTVVVPESSVFVAIPHSYKTIFRSVDRFDYIVIDEAHHYYFAPMIRRIIAHYKISHQLLLTGTPAIYVNNPEFKMVGISIGELLDYGVIVDPHIELVESKMDLSLKDYSHTGEAKFGQLKKTSALKAFKESLSNILEIHGEIKKTMILCSTQNQARLTHGFLNKMGIKSAISISDIKEEQAVLRFTTHKEVRALIVVNRGILGFDFPSLESIIDLTESLNINRITQALCRVIRRGEGKKRYYKVGSSKLIKYHYLTMSFVTSLATRENYFSYSYNPNTKHQTFPTLKFPIRRDAYDELDSRDYYFKNPPAIITFSEYEHIKDGNAAYAVAHTTFKKAMSLLKHSKYALEDLISAAKKYKTRAEFCKAENPKFQVLAARYPEKLDALLPKRVHRPVWSYKAMADEELLQCIPLTVTNISQVSDTVLKEIKKRNLHHRIRHLYKHGRVLIKTLDDAIELIKQYKSSKEYYQSYVRSWVLRNKLEAAVEKYVSKLPGNRRGNREKLNVAIADYRINRGSILKLAKKHGVNYRALYRSISGK